MTKTLTEKSLSERSRHFFPRKFVIGSVLCMTLSSLVVFVIFWCTNIFQNAILSILVVKPGTPMLEWFVRPPIRALYKIRIFNYTNVEDYESGKTNKLKVEEVGPYMYRETITRLNYVFHENNTVSFQERRTFQWEGGSPDDENVVVPNVPLLAATAFLRDSNFMAQLAFTGVLTTLRAKPFVTVPVGGLLWGYDDEIFELGKPIISLQENIPFDRFGLLAHKNGLSPKVLTMFTGDDDLTKLSLIDRVNGVTDQHLWNDPKCDNVYGSEGYIFPYEMVKDPNAMLSVFAIDMCRTLHLHLTGTGSAFGIPTLSFRPPPGLFRYDDPAHHCFCPERIPGDPSTRTCPPHGIYNNSRCIFNMPFVVSLPHFLYGDESLTDRIEGISSDPELHDSILQVHPRMGVVIGGNSRVQLNIETRKAVGIPFLGNLEDGQILPLIWVDVSVDDIPPPILTLMKHGYFTANAAESVMQWGSIVCMILSTGGLVHLLRKQRKYHREVARRKISGQVKLLDESELRTV